MILPMFPLGSVLFPSMFLPLHVFEPRYRELTRRCLEGDREFGVVLIARGSEVGGGDVRTEVGTVAHILEAEELPDGRWVIGAVGVRRIRVGRWLPDAPFPVADVADWEDESGGDLIDALPITVDALRRVLALKSELGEPAADPAIELSDDPVVGSYQVAAVAPFGPLDQQALLAAPGPAARLAATLDLLIEEEGFLRTRLSFG